MCTLFVADGCASTIRPTNERGQHHRHWRPPKTRSCPPSESNRRGQGGAHAPIAEDEKQPTQRITRDKDELVRRTDIEEHERDSRRGVAERGARLRRGAWRSGRSNSGRAQPVRKNGSAMRKSPDEHPTKIKKMQLCHCAIECSCTTYLLI